MSKHQPKTLAIKLDGPLFAIQQGQPDPYVFGQAVPGAARAVGWLKRQGYYITIVTDRVAANDQQVRLMRIASVQAALDCAKVPYDLVTSEAPVNAHLYVADNAMRFINWGKVLRFIDNREVSK